MEGGSEKSQQPILCKEGCGFYGSPAFEGHCSKCYKNVVEKRVDRNQSPCNKNGIQITATTNTVMPQSPPLVHHETTTQPNYLEKLDELVIHPQSTCDANQPQNLLDAEITATTSTDGNSAAQPAKKKRCATCRKKVGFTGFECRCGGLFCTEHRYADMHQCTFDYKSMEREEIRKANPVVQAQKIRKI